MSSTWHQSWYITTTLRWNRLPVRLKGEAIPLESRIILIADTFDAMTSDRPYRRARTTSHALAEIARHSGRQFDPGLVNIALDAGPQLETARRDVAECNSREHFS
jgi:HD-GYP domain-containing protein (c-di-GMP phosphodiesterase class II)